MIADLIDEKGPNQKITQYKLNEALEGSTYTGLGKLFRKHGVRPDGFVRNFTLNQVNEVISKELQDMSYQDRLKHLAKPGTQNINPPEAAPKFASLAQKTAQRLASAAEAPKLGGLKTKTLLPPKPAPEPEPEEIESDFEEPEAVSEDDVLHVDEEETDEQEAVPEPTPEPVKRRGRPVGSKNRPKPLSPEASALRSAVATSQYNAGFAPNTFGISDETVKLYESVKRDAQVDELSEQPSVKRDTLVDELSEQPINMAPAGGLDVAIAMVRALLPQGCSVTITGG